MSTSSLTNRIIIGKAIGFILGAIGFFLIPVIFPDTPPMFRWAVWAWYITFGAFIGVMGIYTRHPVLNIPMPWWFRSGILGTWLNFVLYLFISEPLTLAMETSFMAGWSPLWIVAEGAVIGLLIGYVATKFAGEGKALADNL